MKILCIEDTESNTYVVGRIAQKWGYLLLVAETAAHGLILAHENPDLILVDIGLPDIDGWALTRQIRQFLPDTPIVAITAFATEEDRSKCLSAGCTDYLAKPYQYAELVNIIRQYETKKVEP